MCWHLVWDHVIEAVCSHRMHPPACSHRYNVIQHYFSDRCQVMIEKLFLYSSNSILPCELLYNTTQHCFNIMLRFINLYCCKTYKYSAWKLDPIHWGSKPKYFVLGQQPVVRWFDNTVISSENPCSWKICHYYCFIRKWWIWCGIKFYGHANCYLDQI